MLLKSKFIQASLLTTVVMLGSLIAGGCSSTNTESAAASALSQSIAASPAQAAALTPNQLAGITANQTAALPSNLSAAPGAIPDQKSQVNPSPSGQLENPMVKVAAILGIDQ